MGGDDLGSRYKGCIEDGFVLRRRLGAVDRMVEFVTEQHPALQIGPQKAARQAESEGGCSRKDAVRGRRLPEAFEPI